MKDRFNRKMTPARERRVDSIYVPSARQVAHLLGSNEQLRMDASSVIHLGRQLEELDAETYWVEYPESEGVNILPIKTNIHVGAETYTYQIRDRVGEFAPSANLTDDSPPQDIAGGDDTSKLYSWRGHYAYSVQDLRRGQMAGVGIDNEKAMSARENAETKLDEVLATGYSALGITGFYNNANVSAVTPDVGDWHLAATDADEIVGDLNKVVRAVITDTKGKVKPNMIVLPPTCYAAADSKRLPNTEITALDFFKKKNPQIRVEQWARGETAGSGGGRRIMCGRADRRTLEGLVPVRWETFPPEIRGLTYRVECHLRVGGVIFRYPGAWRRMDGC
jgi:hypothetical protein